MAFSFELGSVISSELYRAISAGPEHWLSSMRSELENSPFTPRKVLSLSEMRSFRVATLFFILHVEGYTDGNTAPMVSALAVLTLQMELPPFCLINSGLITVI